MPLLASWCIFHISLYSPLSASASSPKSPQKKRRNLDPVFISMADDTVLRVALVTLAAGVLLTGFYTHSFTKMFVTYMFGICGIAGVLLPDWTYFNRDFNKWFSPVDLNDDVLHRSNKSLWQRLNLYPLRVIVYATVYWFGARKWWELVSR